MVAEWWLYLSLNYAGGHIKADKVLHGIWMKKYTQAHENPLLIYWIIA